MTLSSSSSGSLILRMIAWAWTGLKELRKPIVAMSRSFRVKVASKSGHSIELEYAQVPHFRSRDRTLTSSRVPAESELIQKKANE
jgi:hypothetical protein